MAIASCRDASPTATGMPLRCAAASARSAAIHASSECCFVASSAARTYERASTRSASSRAWPVETSRVAVAAAIRPGRVCLSRVYWVAQKSR
ncbi:hypothetical protein ACFY5K_35145 [Streptomyces griseofuscus]|uniref:hypothetical protein n=1 Tax=Streptomyces griseofuscus TaxID=146922 RepID=UPI00368A7519